MPAPKISWKTEEPAQLVHCSFCRKTQAEVKKMIAGPDALMICDECVDLCTAIIKEESLAAAAQSDDTWRAYLAERAESIATDTAELNALRIDPRPNVDPMTGQTRIG